MSALPSSRPVSSPRAGGAQRSTAAALPRGRTSGRPRLQVVPAPVPARSVAPYLALCALILLGSLVGALLLNTQMAVASHEIHELQRTLNRQREAETSLRQQTEAAASPGVLRERAEELGMVPADEIAFIDLEVGEIRRVGE